VLFLLLICFPESGECQAITTYPTRQECRDATVEVKRVLRVGRAFFVACTAAPGVGK